MYHQEWLGPHKPDHRRLDMGGPQEHYLQLLGRSRALIRGGPSKARPQSPGFSFPSYRRHLLQRAASLNARREHAALVTCDTTDNEARHPQAEPVKLLRLFFAANRKHRRL